MALSSTSFRYWRARQYPDGGRLIRQFGMGVDAQRQPDTTVPSQRLCDQQTEMVSTPASVKIHRGSLIPGAAGSRARRLNIRDQTVTDRSGFRRTGGQAGVRRDDHHSRMRCSS